ncbi:MAG: beta-hydroxyacyl-ACP dehydratase [Bacteroidales bacterium]|jgi:3-hydroxyacyl-[acyl-carrier-protein] dehydratase|nr:beta-hydroxyacyl-ACP dehydratase [Bacteroidales bacterium]
MKLQDDFFKITDIQTGDNSACYSLKLNADHPVYAAHFPKNPITPGVCIIQMVKELVESFRQQTLFLKKVASVRFLNVINPLEHSTVTIEFGLKNNDNTENVTATVSKGDLTFAKMTLVLIPE